MKIRALILSVALLAFFQIAHADQATIGVFTSGHVASSITKTYNAGNIDAGNWFGGHSRGMIWFDVGNAAGLLNARVNEVRIGGTVNSRPSVWRVQFWDLNTVYNGSNQDAIYNDAGGGVLYRDWTDIGWGLFEFPLDAGTPDTASTDLTSKLRMASHGYAIFGVGVDSDKDAGRIFGYDASSSSRPYLKITYDPFKVSNLQVSQGTYTNYVRVAWTAPPQGADHYLVRRRQYGSGGSFVNIANTSSTSVDTGGTAGIAYEYLVVPVNSSGYEGEESIAPKAPGGIKLVRPSLLASHDLTNKVQVTWTSVPGTWQYEVRRQENGKPATLQPIGHPTSASWDDTTATPGITYDYDVKAQTASYSWMDSDRSYAMSGGRKMSPVTGLIATYDTDSTGVTVSWNPNSPPDGYEVRRGTTSTYSSAQSIGPTTSTSKFDGSTTPGQIYYYWVISVADWLSSNPAGPVQGKRKLPETVSPPSTPSGPTSGQPGQSLCFSTGGSTSTYGHSIAYQFDWGDGSQSGWGSSSQCHSWGNGGTYPVKARARCAADTSVVSDWSSPMSIIICTTLPSPTPVSPSCGSTVSSTAVTVSWSTVANASGYVVRVFNGGSCSTLIYTSAQLSAGTTSLNLSGVGLQSGQIYSWQVQAKGNGSTYCDSGWSVCCSFSTPCTYALGPTATNISAGAFSGSFGVTTTAGCAWTASTTNGWLHTTSSGSGNGTVNFTTDANTTTTARSGAITLQGQVFTVNQAGVTIGPRLELKMSATQILISWPTNAPGFLLEWTTNLTTASWTSTSVSPVIVNGQNTVTNPVSGPRKFFRLRHP